MNKNIRRFFAAALAAVSVSGYAESALSGDEVLSIEQRLSELGFFTEQSDTVFDEKTENAIRNFQIANELEETGEADEKTVKRIQSSHAVSKEAYLEKIAQENADARELKLGSSGSRVTAIQERLKELGFYDSVSDGEFGEATCAAVKRFQLANGLEQTGTVNASVRLRLNGDSPITWSAFVESACASFGDTGTAVSGIQKRLMRFGYFDGACTGNYGSETQKAVSQFQRINGLPETGDVDKTTCEQLYSDTAVALRREGTLYSEDSGENVKTLNAELNALGYPADAQSEIYTPQTETAVRLFQMANGLPTSGEADPETLMRLENGQAIGMERVKDSFVQQVRVQNDSVLALLLSTAEKQRGREFSASDSGFTFTQYVCVAAGVPVTGAEELNALINESVTDITALQSGEVIAFYPNGDTSLERKIGIYAGSWRMICVTQEDSYVLECDISDNGGTLCRWKMVES